MTPEMGEYIVGAYLKIKKGCHYVDYNVRPPVGGLEGLGELDVVGIDLKGEKVYLCEVTTHLKGLNYKDYPTTVRKIREKHARQKDYAEKYLPEHFQKSYMFWSPVVPSGLVRQLADTAGGEIEFVTNEEYSSCIEELRKVAKKEARDFGNPFFRALQIMESAAKRGK